MTPPKGLEMPHKCETGVPCAYLWGGVNEPERRKPNIWDVVMKKRQNTNKIRLWRLHRTKFYPQKIQKVNGRRKIFKYLKRERETTQLLSKCTPNNVLGTHHGRVLRYVRTFATSIGPTPADLVIKIMRTSCLVETSGAANFLLNCTAAKSRLPD